MTTQTKGTEVFSQGEEEMRNGSVAFHDQIHLGETVTSTERNKKALKGDFVFTA